ncbi:MAG: hypothetical protein AAGG07_00255 [Planctomycetota bacterium]
MKLFASLLIMIGTVCGALAAATAYLAPLSLEDDRLIGLTLDAPAGQTPSEGAPERDPLTPASSQALGSPSRTPIAGKGAELTSELLIELRAAGVERVRVTEFSFGRWPGKWAFLGSAAALLVGAMMLRSGAKAAPAAQGESPAQGGAEALDHAERMLDALRQRLELPGGPDLHAITDVLGEVQAGPIAAFIADRPALIAKIGLAGYARVMDRFAAFERSVNRGWSAATDGATDEAMACVERAPVLLAEAKQALAG